MNSTAPFRSTVASVSPLQRQSTTQQAAELLRLAIVEGRLPLGAPLAEHSLSEELGVSRTPLREALQALKSEGLVEIEPYKGARVFLLTPAQLVHLGDFRATLETSALKQAMRSHRPALVARLGQVVDQMQACVDRLDPVTFSQLDTQLHEAVIANCGNEYLIQAYRVVGSRLAVLRNLLRRDDEVIDRSCADHRQLLALAQAGKEREAVAFLAQHVENGTAFFAQSLEAMQNPAGRAQPAAAPSTKRGPKASK